LKAVLRFACTLCVLACISTFVREVHRETVKILSTKEIRDLVLARGNEVIANTPEEFAAKVKRDVPRYRKIILESGIEIQ
jgi:hypothetical protein